MNNYTKTAVLENEIEAQIIVDILTERQIPHMLKSYYSIAYDGLFQLGRGWGAIYAPDQFHESILEILHDLRRGQDN